MADDSGFTVDSFFDELEEEGFEHVFEGLADFQSSSNRYDKLEVLGEGSMKKVWKVYDHFTCRELALAELADPSNTEHLELFLHEARLTSQLDHPNIIQIHDIALNEKSELFYTMDLKVGHNLKDYCLSSERSNKTKLIEMVNIFDKICTAIVYAHSKNIIHLDLKPENTQVGSYGEVIVSDWGLGRTSQKLSIKDAVQQPFSQSQILAKPTEDRLLGTPGFMAPEQYSTDDKNDEQSDIFSLGALLYFFLTGQAPFMGTVEEIKEATINGSFQKPSLLNKATPLALEAICLKAMKVDKAERYASSQEISDDLQRYLLGFTTSAEKTGFITELKRLIKRNPLVSTSLLSSTILIVGLCLYFINSLKQSEAIAVKAQEESEQALLLYENEKKSFDQLSNSHFKTVLSSSEDLKDHFAYKDPSFALAKAIENTERLLKKKNSPKLMEELAYLHFNSFHFFKGKKILKEIKVDKLSDSQDFLLFYEKLPKSLLKSKKLQQSQIAEIFRLMKKYTPRRKFLVSKMYLYDISRRKSLNNYGEVLLEVLRFFNGSNITIDYSPSGSMKITGKDLKSIAVTSNNVEVNFLERFSLKSLNLSGTKVFSPSQFTALKTLNHLNISDTLVKQALDFKRLPNLNSLSLSKGQFSKKELKKVPKHIQIIYVD